MLSPKPSNNGDGDQPANDADDYMSMTILESSTDSPLFETSVQRRARKRRETESRARQPSKSEIAHRAQINRDEALGTSLPVSSKGYQMMARLGFKAGSALGREGNENARTEPLSLAVKENRAGVGMDYQKKRKIKEDAEIGKEAKKMETEGEFRERQAREREQKMAEGSCWAAMRVLEDFEGEDTTLGDGTVDGGKNALRSTTQSIAGKNLLWRGLLRDREEKQRRKRMRYDLHQSLSRNTAYDSLDEGTQDRQAWGTMEEEVEVEDAEMEEFNRLEPAERLRRLVEYLREKWKYCFWCKFQYPDETMDGCPGVTEDEHG
ncbi:MAG: hypothetical protein Q9209_006919 [Squamulea sp. 1 TL-2023]